MFKFQSPDNPIPHDDSAYLHPGAWEEAKVAFGRGSDISQMLTRLERCRLASPRLLLAAAIGAFLSASREQQSRAIRNYLDGREPGAVNGNGDGNGDGNGNRHSAIVAPKLRK